MRYNKIKNIEVSALGFGCMRLPVTPENKIDRPEAGRMLARAIEGGVNYIDTAYMYHNYESESFLGEFFENSGLRPKIRLATKMPPWEVKEKKDIDRIFHEQMERTRSDFFDFYLMHNIGAKLWERVAPFAPLKMLEEYRRQGHIGLIGFSIHDDVDVFRRTLDMYDWDFCQIQYNYLDVNCQAGQEGLEYAAKKGVPVVVMEPLRGGRLAAEPPAEIRALWDLSPVKRTPAQWAFRWLMQQPGVAVTLSGMSAMDQLEDNLKTFSSHERLNEDELRLVARARETYLARAGFLCTACAYCMPCPFGVDIPGNLDLLMDARIYDNIEHDRKRYTWIKPDKRADVCTECGACEKLCPQHIEIRKRLAEAHELLK